MKRKTDAWKDLIAPVREFAASHRGFAAELALALARRTGAHPRSMRVNLDGWTRDDDARRREPGYAAGAALLAEARVLMACWPARSRGRQLVVTALAGREEAEKRQNTRKGQQNRGKIIAK